MLKYCQYYSIVFGGYVALSLWMVQYYVGGMASTSAQLRCRACFSLPGGVLARSVAGCVGQVRRAQCHVVGDVGELDLPVPAVLSADRFHGGYSQQHQDLSYRPQRLRIHRSDGGSWVWPGLSARPVLVRTSATTTEKHRHHQRHRGLAGGLGGFMFADHVRCAHGYHGRSFQRLHADVRRGLGFADLDTGPRCAVPK